MVRVANGVFHAEGSQVAAEKHTQLKTLPHVHVTSGHVQAAAFQRVIATDGGSDACGCSAALHHSVLTLHRNGGVSAPGGCRSWHAPRVSRHQQLQAANTADVLGLPRSWAAQA